MVGGLRMEKLSGRGFLQNWFEGRANLSRFQVGEAFYLTVSFFLAYTGRAMDRKPHHLADRGKRCCLSLVARPEDG
jgi:hypothetical protein